MNHLAIVRILSGIGMGLAALFLLTGLFGLAIGEVAQAFSFVVPGIAVGATGAIVLLLTDKPTRRARVNDALGAVILFWGAASLAGAIPFLAHGSDVTLLTAIYESVSNLTTTGHSLIDTERTPLSSSLLLWRALLHLTGAIASISIAATVFAAINLGGPGIHRNRFFSEPETSFFDAFPRVLRVCTVFVLTVTIILAGLLLSYGTTFRDALSGAVSTISTGMVDPGAHENAPAQGGIHSLILWVGLVIGTLGLVVVERSDQWRVDRVTRDPETIVLAMTIMLVTFLAILAGLPLIDSIGWATSSVSTSGIALSDPGIFHRLPIVLVLFPVLIGGSALSAAGGVKLARMIVLTKRVSLEFVQLGYRGSVQQFSFRGRRQSERTIMGVWVYLVGYIVACTVGVLLFSLSGLFFEDAIRASVGTLSNAGHVIGNIGADLSPVAQFCAIFGMILGRLEVIALLPALNPGFWQR